MSGFLPTLIYGAMIGRCLTLWRIERKPASQEEIVGRWLAQRCKSASDMLKFAPDCTVTNKNTVTLEDGSKFAITVEARK